MVFLGRCHILLLIVLLLPSSFGLVAAQVSSPSAVDLTLKLPTSRFAPDRDAQVLVSTGRLIGGWPFGGTGEHGGYFASVEVANRGDQKLTDLTVTVTASPPLQLSKYDRNLAWHQPAGTEGTFKLNLINPRAMGAVSFSVAVPEVFKDTKTSLRVQVKDKTGTVLADLSFPRTIVPVPIFLWWLSLLSTVGLIGLLYVGTKRGVLYGKRFGTRDIILILVFGLLIGGLWNIIVGRNLGFYNSVNQSVRILFVNQALSDIGWYTLFTLGVLIIRKPGAAMGIGLIHEYFYGFGFGSVIPFGTGWYLRPFAVGVLVDLYMAISYKYRPKLIDAKSFSRTGILNAAIIGGIMPFSWTIVMHLVYHPSIANMYVKPDYQLVEATVRGIFSLLYGALIAYPASLLVQARLR